MTDSGALPEARIYLDAAPVIYAVEQVPGWCHVFLTNDYDLPGIPGITVETVVPASPPMQGEPS